MNITLVIKEQIDSYLKDLDGDTCCINDITNYIKDFLLDNNYNLPIKLDVKVYNIVKLKIKELGLDIIGKNPLVFQFPIKYDNGVIPEIETRKDLIKHERDLHYHLEKFLNLKQIKSMTIFHEISKKSTDLKWLHPDMVGWSHYSNHSKEVLELSRCLSLNIIDLYSFEIKHELTLSNLRKYYFQAVSNSSWANYGYLVVSSMDIFNNDLLMEIQRLNIEFRIGVILLDIKNHFKSKIVVESKKRDVIDRNLINIMVKNNKNFFEYINKIKSDI